MAQEPAYSPNPVVNEQEGITEGQAPNQNGPILNDAPSAPPEEQVQDQSNGVVQDSWYPQLQPKPIPQPGANEDPQPGPNINVIDNHFDDAQPAANQPVQDDEKKEIEPVHGDPEVGNYEMWEGLPLEIASMGAVDMISLQPEGKAVAPSESQVKSRSFTPKSQKIDVAAICKRLHGSIGIFKSKQKRIDAFTQVAITTNNAQRQQLRKHYRSQYEVPLIAVIQK